MACPAALSTRRAGPHSRQRQLPSPLAPPGDNLLADPMDFEPSALILSWNPRRYGWFVSPMSALRARLHEYTGAAPAEQSVVGRVEPRNMGLDPTTHLRTPRPGCVASVHKNVWQSPFVMVPPRIWPFQLAWQNERTELGMLGGTP